MNCQLIAVQLSLVEAVARGWHAWLFQASAQNCPVLKAPMLLVNHLCLMWTTLCFLAHNDQKAYYFCTVTFSSEVQVWANRRANWGFIAQAQGNYSLLTHSPQMQSHQEGTQGGQHWEAGVSVALNSWPHLYPGSENVGNHCKDSE